MKIIITISSLLFLGIFGCSKKLEPPKTEVMIVSNMIGSGALAQNGGIIIMGHSVTAQEVFIFNPKANLDKVWSLKNAPDWTFVAVGWSGDGSTLQRMKGAARCSGKVIKELNGIPTTIRLVLDKTKCSAPFYGPNGYWNLTHKNFNSLTVHTCKEKPQTASEVETGCDTFTERGSLKSFRFIVPTMSSPISFTAIDNFDLDDKWPSVISRAFHSKCFVFDTTSNGLETNIHIPVDMSLGDHDMGFYSMIVAFENTTCDPGTDNKFEVYDIDYEGAGVVGNDSLLVVQDSAHPNMSNIYLYNTGTDSGAGTAGVWDQSNWDQATWQ